MTTASPPSGGQSLSNLHLLERPLQAAGPASALGCLQEPPNVHVLEPSVRFAYPVALPWGGGSESSHLPRSGAWLQPALVHSGPGGLRLGPSHVTSSAVAGLPCLLAPQVTSAVVSSLQLLSEPVLTFPRLLPCSKEPLHCLA